MNVLLTLRDLQHSDLPRLTCWLLWVFLICSRKHSENKDRLMTKITTGKRGHYKIICAPKPALSEIETDSDLKSPDCISDTAICQWVITAIARNIFSWRRRDPRHFSLKIFNGASKDLELQSGRQQKVNCINCWCHLFDWSMSDTQYISFLRVSPWCHDMSRVMVTSIRCQQMWARPICNELSRT